MTTQNRYYSNIATSTSVANSGGLTTSTTTLQLGSTSGFPTSFPFMLRIEPYTLNEELVLVSSGSGTSGSPYVISRGYDQTTAKAHANGVTVQHGAAEIDFAEPQHHLNLTGSGSAAHSIPASTWNNMNLQLISTQTLSATASSITFNSIPQTFNHLYFKCMVQNNGTYSGFFDYVGVQWNGVTTGTYDCLGTLVFTPGSPGTVLENNTSQNSSVVGSAWNTVPGTAGAGFFNVHFPFYSTNTFRKSFYSVGCALGGGTGGGIFYVCGSNVSSTGPITTVTFLATAPGGTATLLETYSSIAMYGSQ